jgi:hypothetical protein
VKIGNEVANRWNAGPSLQKENEQLRAIMRELLECKDDDVSLSSELHTKIQGVLNNQAAKNQNASDEL